MYGLELGLTGESYENVDRRTRRKEAIVGRGRHRVHIVPLRGRRPEVPVAVRVILAAATLLYVKARSERARPLFSLTEMALCAVIVAAGITGVVGLATGFISIWRSLERESA